MSRCLPLFLQERTLVWHAPSFGLFRRSLVMEYSASFRDGVRIPLSPPGESVRSSGALLSLVFIDGRADNAPYGDLASRASVLQAGKPPPSGLVGQTMIASYQQSSAIAPQLCDEDHGRISVPPAITPCCRCEPFNLRISQILPNPNRCISFADRHCSIFGAWRDQPQLGFCHRFQSPLRTNCLYNDPISNSLKVSIGLSAVGGGAKKVDPWGGHRTSR
jgi:hypothetical protein